MKNQLKYLTIILISLLITGFLSVKAENAPCIVEFENNNIKNIIKFEKLITSFIKLKNNNYLVSADNYLFELTPEFNAKILKTFLTDYNTRILTVLNNSNLLMLKRQNVAEYSPAGKKIRTLKTSDQINTVVCKNDGECLANFLNSPFSVKLIKNLNILNKPPFPSADILNKTLSGNYFIQQADTIIEINNNLSILSLKKIQIQLSNIIKIKNSFIAIQHNNEKILELNNNLSPIKELSGLTIPQTIVQSSENNYTISGICDFKDTKPNIKWTPVK